MKNGRSHNSEVRGITKRLLWLLILNSSFLILNLTTSCGKRRPPLPPIENIQQSTLLLSGIQRGNQVLLSFPAPLRNASDASVQSIRRVDVYRLAEELEAPLPLTEEQFAAQSNLIGSLDFAAINGAEGSLTYADQLTFGPKPVRLRYAVRFVNASNQRAAFSNFVLIEPAVRVAEPPVLKDVSVTESTLALRWESPATNVDGSTPVNLLGYNIYRSSPGATAETAQIPLNRTPLTRNEYGDTNFEFNSEYSYVVRTVSLGTEGEAVESLNSNRVTVKPVDRFPPTAPTAVSIAAAQTRLSLFFPANPERDVTGYVIYRSTDPNLPKAQWTRLTRTPIDRTTFQDDAVQGGTRYYYYVIAVDTAGNTSAPSEVASEIPL